MPSVTDVRVVEAEFPAPYRAPHIVFSGQLMVIAVPPGYPREIAAVCAMHAYPTGDQSAIRAALGLPALLSPQEAARRAPSAIV